ncbi:hypothetical protein PLEOSDRAFT_1102587 [Pleurotus ostreatus PC15]|uniref:Uncharacterized protein n=1 Tax=Pleurotus ostreatus (strain PC15) TaxID=1137138 RepID=A0A067NNF9_PLEO1|nr:hypothetical protein PLEOSDRAFT_1102587 [Pleurotus ostreatus PC15]
MEMRAHDNVFEGRGDVAVWNGGRVVDVRDILGDDEGFLAAFIDLDICNQWERIGSPGVEFLAEVGQTLSRDWLAVLRVPNGL